MKDWLIKRLGGYTPDEFYALLARYNSVPAVWEDAVVALKAQGKVTILDSSGPPLVQPHIEGALIVAPRSHASLFSSYSESTYLPVDTDGLLH